MAHVSTISTSTRATALMVTRAKIALALKVQIETLEAFEAKDAQIGKLQTENKTLQSKLATNSHELQEKQSALGSEQDNRKKEVKKWKEQASCFEDELLWQNKYYSRNDEFVSRCSSFLVRADTR